MKRFLLFAFDKYYPLGGMRDFVNSFDSLCEAKDAALVLQNDIIQIYDTKHNEIVFNCDRV